MMNKTKAEIEQMASFICREKGQYMFNKKEIGIITGVMQRQGCRALREHSCSL